MFKNFTAAAIAAAMLVSALPQMASSAEEITVNNTVSGYISLTDGIQLAGSDKTPVIYVDENDNKSVIRAIGDMQEDIESVTGQTPTVTNETEIELSPPGSSGITIGENNMTMTFDFPVPAEADAYIATYNADGALASLAKADRALSNDSVSYGYEFDKIIKMPTGGSISGFVWENMKPFTSVQRLLKPYDIDLSGIDIVVGTIGESSVIDALAANDQISVNEIEGKWEAFTVQETDDTLVIAGSDKRGTVYGIYDFCEKIGVSPWSWWADADPVKTSSLYANLPDEGYTEHEPSVKYRGIFLNDEYNMNQWSKALGNGTAMTHETYEKVFELILRLKANYFWPAMHKYSPTFHTDAENAKLADEYGIIMGSSHSEALLRNNLGELDAFQAKWETEHPDKTLFKALKNESGNAVAYYWTDHDNSNNAVDNKEFLEDYWRESVQNYGTYDNIYTLGMRGVHDGSFQTNMDYATALNEIIATQRKILKEEIADKQGIALEDIPQVFIPYKDVLKYYNNGSLQVPDDVTIMWTDDNYGYVRQNADDTERARAGRTGIYYHVSYYGYPTSYLWLSSTQPGLIREEMGKSYDMGADKIWILNVGDLKPAEHDIEYFLKLARNIDETRNTDIISLFAAKAKRDFNLNDTDAQKFAEIMDEYYELANAKRPEFIRSGEISLTAYGDEAQRYLNRYQKLAGRAEAMYESLTDDKKDAFYELALYPIRSAMNMMTDYIQTDRANLYNSQGRGAAAYQFADEAEKAASAIETDTSAYNKLRNGKWNNMMNINPSALQGCDAHISTILNVDKPSSLDFASLEVAVDSQTAPVSNPVISLSSYDTYNKFIDVINTGYGSFEYTVTSDVDYINFSKTSGTVNSNDRVYVSLDKSASIPSGNSQATITISEKINGMVVDTKDITVNVSNPDVQLGEKTYITSGGTVSIEAEHYSDTVSVSKKHWSLEKDFGRSGDSMKAGPDMEENITNPTKDNAPYLEYNVYFEESGTYTLHAYRMPTLNERNSMKFAVGIDDASPVTLTGTSTYSGSSNKADKWARGVLDNSEKLSATVTVPDSGLHKIRVYYMTPGIVLDKMVLTLGTNVTASYFGAPESYNTTYNTEMEAIPSCTDIAPTANIEKVFEPDLLIGKVNSDENAINSIQVFNLTNKYTNAVVAAAGYDESGNMTKCAFTKTDVSASETTVELNMPLTDDTTAYEIIVFDNFTNLKLLAPFAISGAIVSEGEGETISVKADLANYIGKKSITLISNSAITENISADSIAYIHGEDVNKNSYKFIPFNKPQSIYYIRTSADGNVFDETKSTIINIYPDNNGVTKLNNSWSFDNSLTDDSGANAFVLSGAASQDDGKIKLNTTATGSAKMAYGTPVTILSGETLDVEFDIYFGKLTKKTVSYKIADSNGASIAAMTIGVYDSNFSCTIGGNAVTLDNSAIGAVLSGLNNAALNNTPVHFKNEIDFATGKVNITLSRSGKENAVISGRITDGVLSEIASFEFSTSYNNNERACYVDNASITVNTAPQYAITVNAYDAVSKDTLSDANISLKDKSTNSAVSPSDGVYMLCEGEYIITVTKDGYRTKKMTLDLSPALESKSVNVPLQSLTDITPATVKIEFKDTDGNTVKESINIENCYIGDEYSVPAEYLNDIILDSDKNTTTYTYLPAMSTISSASLEANNTFTIMFSKSVRQNALITINYVDEENNTIKDAVTPEGSYFAGDTYTVPESLTSDFAFKNSDGKYNVYTFNPTRSQTTATLTADTQLTLVFNMTGQYDYYEDFENYTVDKSAWKIGSGSVYPTVEGTTGKYLNFASTGSTIGSYTTLDEIDCTNKKVNISVDLKFAPKGTAGNSQFSIGNSAPSFDQNNINYGITGSAGNASGHIIGLAYNSGSAFLINGQSLETSLIGQWLHLSADVDFAAKKINVTISPENGDDVVLTDLPFYSSCANNIGSMYVRAAKTNGTVGVDNLQINITGDGDPSEQSVLNAKTVYAFGDSIVYGHNAPSNAFMNLIANQYGIYLSKLAKNGATVINSSNTILSQVNAASATEPDFVVFDGYTNDAYGSPETDSFNSDGANPDITQLIGEIQGSSATVFDNTTFCGAFEELLYTMKNKWPNAKIVFVTIHKSGARNFDIQTMLVEKTLAMCEEWGAEVVDMFHDCELDTRNADEMSEYIINGKGSHPNLACCEKYYVPMIADKLESLASR